MYGGGEYVNAHEYTNVMKKYAEILYRVAYNLTQSDQDAQDIIQIVFYKLLTKNPRFDSEEHRKRWLIRVTINESKNLLKSYWYKNTCAMDGTNEQIIFETKEDTDLYFAVMELPPSSRIVIHLYYYEGYSMEEISKILRITESGVRVRLTRARRALKQKLEEGWLDE